MKERITAEWAKKQTEKELLKVIEVQLEMCFEAIENGIANGQYECFCPIDMLKGTGDELRKRGFEVDYLTDTSINQNGQYKISWYG